MLKIVIIKKANVKYRMACENLFECIIKTQPRPPHFTQSNLASFAKTLDTPGLNVLAAVACNVVHFPLQFETILSCFN